MNKYMFIDRYIFIDEDIDFPGCWVRKGWYYVIDVDEEEWLIENEYFGRHIVPEEEMSFPTSADTDEEIDYSLLLNKDSNNGWISPNGDFFGCDFYYHRIIAEKYLKSTEQELENNGWIKLTSEAGPICINPYYLITEKQLNILIQKGYSKEEIENKYNII